MSEAIFSSLVAQARILIQDRRWPEALKSLREAEVLARAEFGPDDKRLAAVLDMLAVVCKECRLDLEAEQAMHESTRIALLHLRRRGRSLADQQKYTDAEKAFREALRICERAYKPNHPETATCLDNLATNLRCQSRFVEAITHCKRAFDIRIAVHGENHGHTAASFSNLGHLHRLLGQHGQAQAMLVKSLVIRKQIYGPDHHHVAESLDRLASLFRDLGRFDDAMEYGEEAVRVFRAAFGPDHPRTAAAIHNLALSRERRSGDAIDAKPVAGGIGGIARPPAEPVGGEIPRENHAPGYWIFGGVAVGLTAAVVTFTYVPWIGTAVAIAVLALGILGTMSIVSMDALMHKAVRRMKGMMTEPEEIDRDAVVLGLVSSPNNVEIEARTRKGMLSADDARELVRSKRNPLDLHFVHSLTQAAADELAKHRGTLLLNSLKEVRSKLAKSLRWHEGRLELNGVPELTEAAAAHLSRHSGDLCLSGLRELPRSVAKHLAHHRGTLELETIKSINEEAANWLIKHRGVVSLPNLRLMSDETRRILRTNPQIEFPDRRSDGLM